MIPRTVLLLAVVGLLHRAPAPDVQGPAVAALLPADGSLDVDPTTTELVVTFDRDMDRNAGWSVCGGGVTFPKVDSIAWRDARTLVLRVRLAPDTRYVLPLNCEGSAQRLCDTRGRRLAPTSWSFATSDPTPADPAQRARNEASLEALRELVATEYSYRDRVVEDWDASFAAARESILAAASDASFARRIGRLLGAARDPHLWIGPREQLAPTFERTAPSLFAPESIERRIGELRKASDAVWYGRIRDGERTVGYLLVRTLESSAQAALAVAQNALDEFARDCDAMVLDLRPNGGGNELLALPIAAWFVTGTQVYAGCVKRNPESGAWDVRDERRIVGNGAGRRFDGPVAVLIGPRCLSSCEAFVLMMRQAERAVLVGSRTGGSSGNPQPHVLPNGVTVWLPSWRATDADGECFEGVGIAPDIEVRATASDFERGDPVLEAALAALRER